jgi:hypothetical protein
MKKIKIRITFQEEILGTASNDPNIHSEYIASKAPDAHSKQEEIEALGVDIVIEKCKTVFPRNTNGQPIFYDYQIKGFFKDACSMLNRLNGKDNNGKKTSTNESGKLTAYKKIIDGLIFVQPRMIPVNVAGDIGECQRPLRAQTAQGERIALASSESIPKGSTVECTIVLLNPDHEKAVKEWLDYGELRGIGQWRNSGKGIFTWEEIS